METQKKTWEKPQLVVLGRGTPEERVLKVCKGTNWQGPITNPSTGNCDNNRACYNVGTGS